MKLVSIYEDALIHTSAMTKNKDEKLGFGRTDVKESYQEMIDKDNESLEMR